MGGVSVQRAQGIGEAIIHRRPCGVSAGSDAVPVPTSLLPPVNMHEVIGDSRRAASSSKQERRQSRFGLRRFRNSRLFAAADQFRHVTLVMPY